MSPCFPPHVCVCVCVRGGLTEILVHHVQADRGRSLNLGFSSVWIVASDLFLKPAGQSEVSCLHARFLLSSLDSALRGTTHQQDKKEFVSFFKVQDFKSWVLLSNKSKINLYQSSRITEMICSSAQTHQPICEICCHGFCHHGYS